MGNIEYTILSGATPITVELTPSSIPPNIHNNLGTFQFTNIPNGVYNFVITDLNGCVYQEEITVNPLITTTTTTVAEGDWFIVGQTNDVNIIFNVNGTNRNDHYNGYPDPNIVDLYLWFKTLNGKPITTPKTINYTINGDSGNTFNFIELSDQIHSEIIENISGPSLIINGNIIFKTGFIEGFFKFSYLKNILSPNFTIQMNSFLNWLSLDVPLTGITNQYGIIYIDNDNVIMKF